MSGVLPTVSIADVACGDLSAGVVHDGKLARSGALSVGAGDKRLFGVDVLILTFEENGPDGQVFELYVEARDATELRRLIRERAPRVRQRRREGP